MEMESKFKIGDLVRIKKYDKYYYGFIVPGGTYRQWPMIEFFKKDMPQFSFTLDMIEKISK